MLIISPSFKNGEPIPKKFTCDGWDINPELQLHNVPASAATLALIMDDPDAIGGKTFVHWIVWNIKPETEYIKEESKPSGSVEGLNSANQIGYIGPCPPEGTPHRYFFKIYALDVRFDITQGSMRDEFERVIQGHVLEEAEVMGTYVRE
ncbi:MAG: YbhB/YbcL family Raf kinase inhibitor-like protein [Patescibacteria group bacterium]|nr:YbhB/YbcL family Raf kinase inhibitor-like protein [Patescibacteria group bacterium]